MNRTLPWSHGPLRVSANGRFLEHADGTPFFWLADTDWLLLTKLTEPEVERVFEDRSRKGFNVVQIMMIHRLPVVSAAGDTAFHDFDCERWDESNAAYWAFFNRVLDLAARYGLYAALVPIWGTVVDGGALTPATATAYGRWLAEHFRDRPNIVWLNGGDTRGSENTAIWDALGSALRRHDPNHLITFHPFGRTQSGLWFHDRDWLDFNMFQSGHRRYDQRTLDQNAATWDDWRGDSSWKGEDNWRYVLEELERSPQRPVLDGEPSYENIPQGLHDPTQPYWTAADCRRYLWWSVLAGACGHTYGDNAVMQFHREGDADVSYGARNTWQEAIDDPGAAQMAHAKRLMLSLDWFSGRHDATCLAGNDGTQYDRIIAMRGSGWLAAYTFTGKAVSVCEKCLPAGPLDAFWLNPATGRMTIIDLPPEEAVPGTGEAVGSVRTFRPSGPHADGTDHVLVLAEAGRLRMPEVI